LGWVPKTSFPDLVKLMVEAELQAESESAAWNGL
jgi:GDP-D-mannose dehydratase